MTDAQQAQPDTPTIPDNFARAMRQIFLYLLKQQPSTVKGMESFTKVHPQVVKLRIKAERLYAYEAKQKHGDPLTLTQISEGMLTLLKGGASVEGIKKMSNKALLKQLRDRSA